MEVCVYGLWHLGCVTAACLARAGHTVVAVDPDAAIVDRLREGRPSLFEPGLEDLIGEGRANRRLRFEQDLDAAGDAEIVWVTFDTPVDNDDKPQPAAVVERIDRLVDRLNDGCLVLISSQLPVGTTRRLAAAASAKGRRLTFGYSPENLQLGRAIDAFTRPGRVVVGLERAGDRQKVEALLAPFTDRIEWMAIESAEMTKHAINAFLATSVAFMNEVAALCETVGADATEVERGLKSETRIGPRAYLSPGGAFAGGTLARDLATLAEIDPGLVLINAVRASNDRHLSWELRKLRERFQRLAGRRIAIFGLAYKPGTDSLRRSSAVALALALGREGVRVIAFDPAVKALPGELAARIALADSPEAAVASADAAIVATAWPEFRDLPWERLLPTMSDPTVIDPNWLLAPVLRDRSEVAYAAVGLPWRRS